MDRSMTQFDYAKMDQEERPFARRLALWIDQALPGRVTDLGAGTGVYVEELHNLGRVARGYDIAHPQPRPDLVQVQSIFNVADPAPTVLCLEVAEHIPAGQANTVIESIWRNTEPGGHVIFSAAQPGQGGVGHINCQLPEYWTVIAEATGFQRVFSLEHSLHTWITSGYHMGWFARNRQVWRRPA